MKNVHTRSAAGTSRVREEPSVPQGVLTCKAASPRFFTRAVMTAWCVRATSMEADRMKIPRESFGPFTMLVFWNSVRTSISILNGITKELPEMKISLLCRQRFSHMRIKIRHQNFRCRKAVNGFANRVTKCKSRRSRNPHLRYMTVPRLLIKHSNTISCRAKETGLSQSVLFEIS